MTTREELLEIAKENNALLKEIVYYLRYYYKDDSKEFGMNVMTNLISNKLFPR